MNKIIPCLPFIFISLLFAGGIFSFIQKRALARLIISENITINRRYLRIVNFSNWVVVICFFTMLTIYSLMSVKTFLLYKNLFLSESITKPGQVHYPAANVDLSQEAARRFRKTEYLYYEPYDESEYYITPKRLPPGEGIIRGKVIINNAPAAGFNITLKLDKNRFTQPAKVNENGEFEIDLPKGQYFYKGFIVDGEVKTDKELILIKKEEIFSKDYSKKVLDRFKELEAEYGEERASQLLVEELKVFDYERAYPLIISDKVTEIPDIIYRNCLSIISPRGRVDGPVDKVQFIWEAIPGAKSYDVKVCKIEQKTDSTHYSSYMDITGIDSNVFMLSDLDKYKVNVTFGEVPDIMAGELYGVKVRAFDENGELITYSSEHEYVKFMIIE